MIVIIICGTVGVVRHGRVDAIAIAATLGIAFAMGIAAWELLRIVQQRDAAAP
jgi:hypothetical protein